jgi:hypothetical protein
VGMRIGSGVGGRSVMAGFLAGVVEMAGWAR